MDKLKMHSPDLSLQNIDKIRALFPNCVTEAQNSDGSIKLAIDFDQLKQELSDSIVEGPQERYRIDWPGKREALLAANSPIAKTLRPCRKESVNFDKTKNLFIEGDNLEALKLLQETYLGKVKMIYIDPPYNTGKDFIYKDNFTQSNSEFLSSSNQIGENGSQLVTNLESNGRFHSDWLSMIYPRLKLARNLLTDNGVIFISIDDCEVVNLKKICDEIFGEDNFIEQFVWIKKTNPPNNVVIGSVHEYILAYAKNKSLVELYLLPRSDEADQKYKNPDNDPRGVWTSGDLSAAAKGGRSTPSLMYSIKNPVTGQEFPPPPGRMWIVPKDVMEQNIIENKIWWGTDGLGKPKYKRFLSEVRQGVSISTLISDFGNNGTASKELNSLFDGSVVFETPKPVSLLKLLLHIASKNSDIVMDFFSGSATIAHSVMEFNAETGNNVRYIAVQIPEPYPSDAVALTLGLKDLSEAARERIRRAAKQISERFSSNNFDLGFRAFKIDTSNYSEIHYSPQQTLQSSLELFVNNIKSDRTAEDLVFQILIDWGIDLTSKVETVKIQKHEIILVENNTLVACFEEKLTEQILVEVANLLPLRVVFRDDVFLNDAAKINAEQIFRQLSPHTEIKTI